MLPVAHRLHRQADFTTVVRRGRRASRPLLTVHLLEGTAAMSALPVRAGLVVSRAVGPSVTRHAVSRRLRHLLRQHVLPGAVSAPPGGSQLVVRASPRAAGADSAALGADLDAALSRLARR